jgi:RNA polymerase sigma-70 factor (ECF subfamily)
MQRRIQQLPDERDVELLQAIALGDRRALEQLYLSYHRRLTRFVSRLTPRYETVEEVVNDAFMVVWQHAKEFRGASQVSTWIIGITYRVAMKALRGNDVLLNAQRLEFVPEPMINPVDDTELQDWMAWGLNQLPMEQRVTMELAYHMGHSIEEIAAITECPVGTVKARMFHARKKLQQCMPAISHSSSAATASSGLPTQP